MKCWRLFVLVGALAVPCWAEDGDAPDQGVARISVLVGDATVRRGDTGEFVAAELNAPLVSLDHLLTDEKSRAEIQLDWANFVRVARDSEVRLAELRDRDFLIQVSLGTATFRVLEDSASRLEISTPNVAIRPRRHGTYRVTVGSDFTEVTVRSGEAEIFAGGNTEILRAGQTLEVNGDAQNPRLAYLSAIPRDEWDRWNESRDRELERRDSYRYVSRDIYGVEDLGSYGHWVYDAPYGWVWVPNVSVTWAPYRVGRWTWVNYYGWTWVSGDPWGWAPYHYGRWYHAPRYGWVWYPGETRVRYYWRPALVAFFGWGTVNVGWVPLAPYEVYRPWYGSRTTVVNYTTVTNINIANFRNARFVSGRTGVTSVVSRDFGRRKTTINNYVVAKDRDLRQVADAGRWLPQPSRENRQFSDRKVPDRISTRREVDRKYVSTRPEWNGRDRQPGPADTRRADAPRNDGRGSPAGGGNRGVASPRNDNADRGRESDTNRGGGPNPVAAAPNRPDNSRRPEASDGNRVVAVPQNDGRGREAESNRGRAENPVAAAPSRPDNSQRPEASDGNRVVTFPRNDNDRREAENRGRGANPVAAAPNRPDTSRRPEASDGNRVVTFPQNGNGRGREAEGNRDRGENAAAAGATAAANRPDSNRPTTLPRNPNAPAAPNRSDNGRRPEVSDGNRPTTFPRNDANRGGNAPVATATRPEDVRRPEPAQRNPSVDFPRPEAERPRPNPEVSRPSEPPRRAEIPQPREENRGRPEMPPRREAEPSRPAPPPEAARRPEPQRQQEPRREEPRGNPRSESPAPQPPPQASSPAPSAPPSGQSGPSDDGQGNNSGGRGRGRR